MTNSVTVYQNGIAAFERQIEVHPGDKPTRMNLPLKVEHLGDFLNTITVLGDGVKLSEPPSYAPERQKPALIINPSSVTKSLFNSLSGAEVTVHSHNGNCKGEVVGTDTETKIGQDGTKSEEIYLNIMLEDGTLRRLNLRNDVSSYVFTDPTVRADLKKALAYNLEQTKPGNTFVGLGLSSAKQTKASLRYAIPTAAWKLTYRLRNVTRADEGKNLLEKWLLEGMAVVDNPTDEDWHNYVVTVATGTPVTFGLKDLASVRLPKRSEVKLVNEHAAGAVEVEAMGLCAAPAGGAAAAGAHPQLSNKYTGDIATFKRVSIPLHRKGGEEADFCDDSAQFEAADVSDVGDFSVFTSPVPVSIEARKSGLIPLFTHTLGEADTVLYASPNKPSQPMRAVKFTNSADFTLGRGSVSVENTGVHVGSAVLSLTKPGKTALLCHAVESSVQLSNTVSKLRNSVSKLSLSDSFFVTESKYSQTTTYEVRNHGSDVGVLIVDHQPLLPNGEVEVSGVGGPAKVLEKLSGGVVRIQVELEPDAGTSFKVNETRVDQTKMFIDGALDWFASHPDSPLLKGEKMTGVKRLNDELQSLRETVQEKKNRLSALNNTQDRLRKNLASLGDNGDLKKQLIDSEREIGEIDAALPKLEAKRNELVKQLRAECAKVTASWTA